ncbi:winged helix-turn-helix transcriptional regulator [Alkalicoccus halolimnae]|jgi:DNA-binding HxlR family transcriptional regulator|uniref:Helix-turn-helix domain-containing protein n=1 Tax=Alkalicoccus halolimnae TaxID=1667239 RepID=A0A5C7FGL9_9BACI|nr:helix-turn-helix domain-containing protein [Alkalicoccus halolimnae]TXF83913.1 helix-turn-helix transcriptional regulator [Alkalicoccus halolimnae]
MKKRYPLECNIAQTLNLVGDRWTMLVLHEVLVGRETFNYMKQQLTGISANILSERLKHLEQLGLIESTLYSDHPPRHSYRPTESGQAFSKVFDSMLIWGRDHLDECYKKLVHTECQSEVAIDYYCACCEKRVSQEEVQPVELEKEKVQ